MSIPKCILFGDVVITQEEDDKWWFEIINLPEGLKIDLKSVERLKDDIEVAIYWAKKQPL